MRQDALMAQGRRFVVASALGLGIAALPIAGSGQAPGTTTVFEGARRRRAYYGVSAAMSLGQDA
jgi:hypothetical protein